MNLRSYAKARVAYKQKNRRKIPVKPVPLAEVEASGESLIREASIPGSGPGDLLVKNGCLAGDPADRAVSIVARDGQIIFVGQAEEGERFIGPDTRVIDGGGRTVLPGFTDSHLHLSVGAEQLTGCNVEKVTQKDDLARDIAGYIKKNPDVPVVYVYGLHYFDPPLLTPAGARNELDEMVSDRPVFVYAHDLHTGWANTRALEESGLFYKIPPFPEALVELEMTGNIVLDDDGFPTGELREPETYYLVDAALMVKYPQTHDQKLEGLRKACLELASYGITSVHNMGLTLPEEDIELVMLLLELEGRDLLPIRVHSSYSVVPDEMMLEDVRAAAELRDKVLAARRGDIGADELHSYLMEKLEEAVETQRWLSEPSSVDSRSDSAPVSKPAPAGPRSVTTPVSKPAPAGPRFVTTPVSKPTPAGSRSVTTPVSKPTPTGPRSVTTPVSKPTPAGPQSSEASSASPHPHAVVGSIHLEPHRQNLATKLREAARVTPAPIGKVFMDAIKIFMDGVIEKDTAFCLNKRPVIGIPAFDSEELGQAVPLADHLGLAVRAHSIGDGSVKMLLDAVALARKSNAHIDARRGHKIRHRIEHIELCRPQDINRFAELETVPSMQPFHERPPGDPPSLWFQKVPESKWETAFPWNSLVQAGAKLTFGSDWPIVSCKCLGAMLHCISRQPWREDLENQGLGFAVAVDGFCANPAYAVFEENVAGRIKRGMVADLVILSDNLEPDGSGLTDKTEVIYTICDGAVVYQREDETEGSR